MELLKNLEKIHEPDNRRVNSVVLNHETGVSRPLALEDLYDFVEQLEFKDYVPQEIINHFQMARNLYLYSWFYYPFNIAAQLYAFITIEFALKEKFADKSPIVITEVYQKPKHAPFKKLLKQAVDGGFIKDSGFSYLKATQQNSSIPNSELESPELSNYCAALIEIIPELRNRLAHGSSMLNNRGGDSLIVCVELINQLFSNE